MKVFLLSYHDYSSCGTTEIDVLVVSDTKEEAIRLANINEGECPWEVTEIDSLSPSYTTII